MNRIFFWIAFAILITSACQSDSGKRTEKKQSEVTSEGNHQGDRQSSDASTHTIEADTTNATNAAGTDEDGVNEQGGELLLSKDESDKNSINAKNKPETKTTPAKKVRKPRIEFESMMHDFGTLVQGDSYNHKFQFKNTGNAPLEIKSAKGSCGCAQPSFPFLEIEPGEEGFIGVNFNSATKEADQLATIAVKTNIDTTTYLLKLTGTVTLPEEDVQDSTRTDSVK